MTRDWIPAFAGMTENSVRRADPTTDRPTITSVTGSAADKIEHNEAFYVVTSDWNSIASVVLMGTGAATHSFDHNQRYVPLEFTKRQTGDLQVTAPAHGQLAPPGYYMLFIVDNNGVPSVARMVQLTN